MFDIIIEKLKKSETVGILTHINPDGDGLGSAYSLKAVLESMGKCAKIFYDGACEDSLLKVIKMGVESQIDKFDLMVAFDCADAKRLGSMRDEFLNHNNTIAIDHHITHCNYAGVDYVENVSSNCEIMYKLYKAMNIKIPNDAYHNVYVGMATDTGNFKYSSVTGDTMRIAAEIIDTGVDFSSIAKKVFDTKTKEYLALQKTAIDRLKFFCDDKIAYLYLSDGDFSTCGIDEANSAAIVNLPSSIEGVEVGIYVRKRGESECKVSLRAVNKVDVSEIAFMFGGGGHKRASGYSVEEKELPQNMEKLISEIEKRL